MTPHWLPLSLRWKLILGSAFIEIVMLSLLVINTVRLIETSLREQFVIRLGEISVLLNASISPLMAQLDYGPIYGVFEESQHKNGIVYFVLFDNNGKQVAKSGWAADQPLPTIQKELDLSGDSRRFDAQIQIGIGGQSYGQLRFGISTEFLHSARAKLVRQSLAIAALEIMLSVALLVLLGIWLTQHLRALESASREVGNGNFNVIVNVTSRDEIGQVGDAFNRMTGEIKNRLLELGSRERLLNLSQQAAKIGSYAIDLNTGKWNGTPLLDEILGIDEHFEHDIASWRSILHPDDSALVVADFQKTLWNGQTFSREYRIIRPLDGEVRWVVAWGDFECDSKGTPFLQVGAVQDVTERKQAEDSLKKQVAAREKAEGELRNKVDELARSNADLEQFAYISSHDLREPLRMISSFISLTERRLGDNITAEIKEFIGFAVEGAKRMDQLIQDLLDYSLIGRENKVEEAVDPKKSIADVLANLSYKISETGAKIECEDRLPSITARPKEVVILFQNLISNAIKYCQDGVVPTVKISARREGSAVRFVIADNGIGIEPDECERIFGIFKRLHTKEKYHGTGIGLAICKKIVNNHGGEISASSGGVGTGTSFTFTMPEAQDSA
jgi:PAS domain S-box-containing protein